MATSQSTIEYIKDQFSFLPDFKVKKMFGEYGIYNGSTYFGLVCENKLFFKTTKDLISKIGDDGLRAYPGSKNSLHIPEEIVEDKDKLKALTLDYLTLL